MSDNTRDTQNSFTTRLAAVRARITAAERQYGRAPGSVALLAISKQQPVEVIATAFAVWLSAFGENYLQEALPKIAALAARDIVWHFTGALQSSKTQTVAQHFAWVHSVDRLKLAERLSTQRPSNAPPLNVCIQVNVGDETQKAGIAPAETPALARAIAVLPRLRLRGLMCLPPERDDVATPPRNYHAPPVPPDDHRRHGPDDHTKTKPTPADPEAAIAEAATPV